MTIARYRHSRAVGKQNNLNLFVSKLTKDLQRIEKDRQMPLMEHEQLTFTEDLSSSTFLSFLSRIRFSMLSNSMSARC